MSRRVILCGNCERVLNFETASCAPRPLWCQKGLLRKNAVICPACASSGADCGEGARVNATRKTVVWLGAGAVTLILVYLMACAAYFVAEKFFPRMP